MQEQQRGFFLVIEGLDGGGKTTLSRLLAARLRGMGFDVLSVREPGGTLVGEAIRNILLDRDLKGNFPYGTELFLFLAARYAFVEQIVRPAVGAGTIVIADRFDLSTKAYQVSGRCLPEKESLAANELAKSGVEPNLYVVLTVSSDVGLARKKAVAKLDRIESEDAEFHERVEAGYKRFGRGSNYFVLDTTNLDPEGVEKAVWEELLRRFPETFPL